MAHARWGKAIEALRAQGEAVRAADERVEECQAAVVAGEASHVRLTTAVALWRVCEADYLRCAVALLSAHLAQGRPPVRMPVAVVWPRPLRQLWKARAQDRSGGVWRALPGPKLLAQVEAAGPDVLLDDVAEAIRALQASLHGHRTRPRLYEAYIPDRSSSQFDAGRTAPTMRGFPDPGHWVNQSFARGSGRRVQPGRGTELRQLESDERAVHERAENFGAVVLRLLEHHHGPAAAPSGRAAWRGAARWVGREQQAVASLDQWPGKLSAAQVITVGGLGWLVLMLAAIPWSVAMKSRVLTDHPTPFLLTSFAVAGLGAGVVYRFGPHLMRLPGTTAAVPGVAAAAVAYLVMQVQGPVTGYFFADPLDRFERQFTSSCLAASPYRLDEIQSETVGKTLVVRPISGDTTLRLGPAEDGGTHPLSPRDSATRTVLAKYGCELP
ncbi:hypothetical protein [Streptomyces sp. NBC_00582]|uniref:hypothetical protein n=1 Tax=Streptomyces sp. NBC_00582 TaxID=2975783 RepID=UPI002E80B6CB|nr:hypothetical protein [Streptomyces sp. NBC_00582]WUB68448.1 hypothetical protein OG852_49990 [Streptomyces sp. NBC_00582]